MVWTLGVNVFDNEELLEIMDDGCTRDHSNKLVLYITNFIKEGMGKSWYRSTRQMRDASGRIYEAAITDNYILTASAILGWSYDNLIDVIINIMDGVAQYLKK